MSLRNSLDWYKSTKDKNEHWVNLAKLKFASAIEKLMATNGVRRKDLAVKIDSSQAYVTKLLRGDANLTIETMVKLSRALDSELHIYITPKEANKPKFFYTIDGGKPDNSFKELTEVWQKQEKKTQECSLATSS